MEPESQLPYAKLAGMDLADLGTKTVLCNAFKDAGSPLDPNNGEAIRIVGVAAGAIKGAKDDGSEEEEGATEEPKGKREVMLDSFTIAFVSTYKTFAGKKSEVKKLRPQDVTARSPSMPSVSCTTLTVTIRICAKSSRPLVVGRRHSLTCAMPS